MKKIFMTFVVAMLTVMTLVVVANAEPIATYDIVETETSGLYQIVATISNDEGDFRVFANTVSFDFSIIKPSNYKGKATDIVTSMNSKAPLTVYTYTTTEYDPDLDEDVETTVTADYAQNPIWSVDGDRATLVFETYKTPAELPTNGMAVFKMYFVLAEGKTFDDFTSSTFTVETIDWTSGTNLFFYGQDDAGYATNMSVVNNVVPEAAKVYISVAEGDKVYLQDGTVEIATETTDAYEVPAEIGYVAVNTGNTAQATWYVDGTTATKVHTNGVFESAYNTLRDRTEYVNNKGENLGDRNGMRFKFNHNPAGRKVEDHEIVEVGFIMTAESSKILTKYPNGYTLDMNMVNEEYAKVGKAYGDGVNVALDTQVDDAWIMSATFYNIPITEEGVQTKIVSRPYYKVGETYIYGELASNTLYDAAKAIKNDATEWAKCTPAMQDYINEILFCVEGTEMITDEVIIDVSGLYE